MNFSRLKPISGVYLTLKPERKDSSPAAKIQKKHQTTKFTTENQPQNFNYAKLPKETTDQFSLHNAPIPTPRTPELRMLQ